MKYMAINSNIRNAWYCQRLFGTPRTATLTVTADFFRIDRHRIFDHLNEP